MPRKDYKDIYNHNEMIYRLNECKTRKEIYFVY